jgi:hypothetical protein
VRSVFYRIRPSYHPHSRIRRKKFENLEHVYFLRPAGEAAVAKHDAGRFADRYLPHCAFGEALLETDNQVVAVIGVAGEVFLFFAMRFFYFYFISGLYFTSLIKYIQ